MALAPQRKDIIDTREGLRNARIGLVDLPDSAKDPWLSHFGLVYQSPAGKRYLARLKNLGAADVCAALRKMADEILEHDLGGVKEQPAPQQPAAAPPVICTNCQTAPATVNGCLCPACYTIANEP